jgi:drug/metabolite transporter (DMT)-like permease
MQDFTDGVKQDILEKIKIIHKPPMPLTQGLLYVNLTALLFGTSAVLIKSASETDMPPEYTLPLRFTIAALCFAPQIVRGLKDARIRDAGVWK